MLKLQKDSYEYYFYTCVAWLFTIFSIVVLIIMEAKQFRGGDNVMHWKILAYTLRGFDPYLNMITQEIPEAVQDIGALDPAWGATPWGLILGNVYYLGFISLDKAKLCFLILCVVSLVVVLICLYFKAEKIYDDKRFVFLLIVIALGSTNFLSAINARNASGIISCMLLLAWILCDSYPVITGLLLGIAMSKPQDAALICFAFLLQKKFLPLIIAAVVDIAAWFYASVLTGSGMIKLLEEFAYLNIIGQHSSGIFATLISNSSVSMFCSMATGIILTAICMYYSSHENKNNAPKDFSLCFGYIFTAFWCYSTNTNFYTLLFPIAVCLYFMMKSEKFYQRLFWFGICLFMNGFRNLSSKVFFYLILGRFPEANEKSFALTFGYLGLIIIAFIILFSLTSRKQKN